MRAKDILSRVQEIVDEQSNIDAALAKMHEQRESLTKRRTALDALLAAVGDALGVSVAKAPEEPAVELHIAAKAEPSKPAKTAKQSSPRQANDATANVSIMSRVASWCAARETPFKIDDVRRDISGASYGVVSYYLVGLAHRRVIVRVERGRYMRADLVQPKPKPVAAPAPVSHATDAPKRDDASPSRYDRVRAWCLTQTGTITASMASAAFPEEKPGNIAIALGIVGRTGDIIRRVSPREYERVIVAAPAMPQAQQEAA